MQRKAELADVVDADAKLMEQFNTMVPANHPARAQLLKSYRKNIKRSVCVHFRSCFYIFLLDACDILTCSV